VLVLLMLGVEAAVFVLTPQERRSLASLGNPSPLWSNQR
jgi:hypothetical protein